jgi:hypothetical protein
MINSRRLLRAPITASVRVLPNARWLLAILIAPLAGFAPTASASQPEAAVWVYRDSLKPLRFWQTPVWSESRIATAPIPAASPAAAASVEASAAAVFRGPFQAQPVTLSLAKLPEHAWVRVRFKLLIIGSWDGSSPVWGPDLWSLQVRGGQRLVFTSFGNMGAFVNNNLQAFPDNFPWGRHPAWTGAASKDTLHFPKMGGGSTLTAELNDSTYPIEVLFPHTAKSLVLDFTGVYGDAPKDRQMWGIGELEVVALSEPAPVDDDALLGLWNELAGEDPVRANEALWALVAAGERASTLIAQKVARVTAEVKANERGLPPVTGLEALQLHRARRILGVLNSPSPDASFAISHLVPEYFDDPDAPIIK